MQRELAGAVKRLKSGNALSALFFLAGLSFVYGIVHAAGPGHGKAIISSYVVANEETVRRGILVSFLAAFVQGLAAVVLVLIMLIVVFMILHLIRRVRREIALAGPTHE